MLDFFSVARTIYLLLSVEMVFVHFYFFFASFKFHQKLVLYFFRNGITTISKFAQVSWVKYNESTVIRMHVHLNIFFLFRKKNQQQSTAKSQSRLCCGGNWWWRWMNVSILIPFCLKICLCTNVKIAKGTCRSFTWMNEQKKNHKHAISS